MFGRELRGKFEPRAKAFRIRALSPSAMSPWRVDERAEVQFRVVRSPNVGSVLLPAWARGIAGLVACVLLGAAAAGCGDAPDAAMPRFPGANLILISLDTLRADALSMYGGADRASPALAAFAEEAVVFAHARSQSPHTAPSHMSIFTSLFPSVHGVQNVAVREHPVRGESPLLVRSIPDTIPTLADVLAASGYDTVGLSNGGNLNPSHGFDRGFRNYSYFLRDLPAHIAKAREWLAHFAETREPPFYFFWHTYEIHAPYLPPVEYAELFPADDYAGPLASRVERFRRQSSQPEWGKEKWDLADQYWRNSEHFDESDVRYLHGLYHGEVAYTDAKLGTLFAELRAGGLLDSSIVVVLSDHGEQFREHGSFGHDEVFEETLRVPLLIRLPGGVLHEWLFRPRAIIPALLFGIIAIWNICPKLGAGVNSLFSFFVFHGTPILVAHAVVRLMTPYRRQPPTSEPA